LELLATDFAVKCTNAGFLVEFNGDGLFMVAKEAGKDAW
jgi:hypothetical protein